jgi:2'-5' RNA ligase
MPHINFIFPFVESEHLEDMKERLKEALSKQKPFKLDLSNLSCFQKKRVTFHLKPSSQTELNQLYAIIRKTLPEVYVKRPDFQAHLTLGQCPKKDYPDLKAELEAKMENEDFNFNVDGIYIIQRSKEDKTVPFKIVHKIQFSS